MTTRQQVFDKAALGILEQGEKSLVIKNHFGANECKYRDDQGRKCAIGHAIPDDKYSHELEGRTVAHPEIMDAVGLPYDNDSAHFIDLLQDVHDGRLVEQWPEQLIKFASQYGLSDKVVRDWQEAQKS